MTTPSETWDGSYATSTSPPWDIGRPQPAFVRLADTGLLSGRLLDAGCGTGEQTLLAASKGANALGIDISPRAIQRARDKAAERGIAARFEVADALNLWQFGLAFDTVIDSGVFHIFDDEDRARCARTSCAPRSATAGMSPRSSRRSSRSTRNPGSAPRPWRPGWPPSAGCY
jgi:2-polyprenyl-3-methyl-5-hydroxy-6-metoxy-1,4-benzoquinol methylase